MYYQTKIKKIHNGGATDLSGKSLEFIGNLPCKEGDVVWTDGTFIFGHVPIRGTPLIPVETGGIPALSDNLRGYFNKSGNFKKYNVALDNWIVNDNKKFAHGNSEVYDAEISYSGDLLTAELVNNSLMRIYKNGYTFLDVDANSFADSNFISDSSLSAVYNAEFINFKLLRDGTYDALVTTTADVTLDNDSGSGNFNETQTPIFNQLLTREEFLNTDFPFEHEEYGGHPLMKTAILTFWELCLFADYKAGSNHIDRGFYRDEYVSLGSIDKVLVEIYQKTQGSGTVNIQGGVSGVSNGTVTARKNAIPQSFIDGEIKGSVGETGDYTGDGNFFDHTSAIGVVTFDSGEILLQQTRVKNYLVEVPEGEEDERVWRDPNGRSIPLNIFSCPFNAYAGFNSDSDSNTAFIFYEATASINDLVADDEYGLTYKFRLVYNTQVDDSETTIYTPYFILVIDGKYKCYTRKIIDTSGGGGGAGGGSDISTEYLTFPVQDGFYFDEQFNAVMDSDSNIVFANDNFTIYSKLSATKLKGGGYLVGDKDSALYLVKDGQAENTFEGCNNFRLRELKNISKAKK